MVKKIDLKLKHGDDLLIDKILRIRYANLPDSDTPTASYPVIAKYLKVSMNTIIRLVDQYKKRCNRQEETQ